MVLLRRLIPITRPVNVSAEATEVRMQSDAPARNILPIGMATSRLIEHLR
jgi:hypothetical protein